MKLQALTFLSVMLGAGVACASLTVRDPGGDGDFPLVTGGRAAPLVVDADDYRVVAIAAACLADDVQRVSGRKPAVVNAKPEGPAVIIGSLDRSRAIRALVEAGKLDVGDLKGQWECFKIARVDDSLVIVGSDRRGTAYGALELSRAIGVSPWNWWADVPPRRRDGIHVSTDAARIGPPSVKYRGIFLNDEDWGLQPWAAKTFEPEAGDIGPKTYAKIFELLLRLKANYCWPAMHDTTRPFNSFPQNKQVADDYAIVMGSSHAEPMLRNNVGEWPADQKEKWDPVTNLPGILAYWESRVRENGKFENVYTVGMRGIHDSGMPGAGTPDEKRERLEKVIALQRDMLARHVNKDAASVPQIFCPYKEVLDIYRGGMKLPDDVTIVWPDDNHGFIRQLPGARERKRGGGHGIYYHISYWGRPHDYLWLESTSPALIWHEMTKAYDCGARRLWVVNVGDIKPAEAGTTLFLELAWGRNRYGPDVQRAFLRDFYREQFGEKHADAIAELKDEYFRLCAIRRPEHLGFNGVYPNAPVGNGDWPDEQVSRVLERWLNLSRRAEALAGELPKASRDAYFQLVEYPARAGAAMAEKLLAAEQARRSGSSEAVQRAEAALRRIEQLTGRYNAQRDGKWRHMMSHRPRNLPVFEMPPTTRPTTAPAATTSPARAPAVVTIDVARPARLSEGEIRWVVIEGLGRSGGAVSIFPRVWQRRVRSEDGFRGAPVAEYAVDLPEGAEQCTVTVDALPTHPITPEHQLICGVSFDDQPPQVVRFEQSSDERDRTWQQNVLRNAMSARATVRLRPGRHTLRLWGLDPSVAVQAVTVTASEE